MYVQEYTVMYLYMYIVLTCLSKLAPYLVINLDPSDEGDTCNVGTLWLGTKGVR